MIRRSGAAAWPVLRQFIDAEARIAARMSRRPATAALYEFLRFGMKQAWACLFGALMIALLLATYFLYPPDAALARYDFLFLAALLLQVSLLGFGLETFEEAKVIAAYHVVGTVMEIFKTSVGSWIYPDDCFFRIAGVPLFSGFMYSCIGSYICRAWTLFHFEFKAHPPIGLARRAERGDLRQFLCAPLCARYAMGCCSSQRPSSSRARASISSTGKPTGGCRCCWDWCS